MGEAEKVKDKLTTAGKYLACLAIAILCLVALSALAIGLYLATPLPARQVSRLLTSYLHQNFSVDSLQTAGSTLHLRGVRLDNPPGFPKGAMVAADSVAIAPRWGDLLLGRQSFRLIALDGIRITLERDSKGAWNFVQLQQLLASKKAAPTETRIQQLTVQHGSLKVEGQEVRGIALRIFNLATKGSRDAKVDLAFEDAAHNLFSLKGQARAGSDPALDLALTAPALSLQGVSTWLNLKKPDLFEGGSGSLQANTSFHKGELRAAGNFRFTHLRYSSASKIYPLTGNLEFAADYSMQRDAAQLKSTLTVNNQLQVQAAGAVQDLKYARNFALDLAFSDIDLRALNTLMSEEARRNLIVGGRLGCRALHIAGNGSKVTGASGLLQLRDGTLARGGRLLAAGLTGTAAFSRAGDGVHAEGRLSLSGPHGKALLETLDLPFDLSVSRQLKLLKAQIPSFSAQLSGVPCSGRLAFDAGRESPLTVSLKLPVAKISALQPLLGRYELTARSGTASLALEASGRSPQQWVGTVGLQLADFRGARGKNALEVEQASVNARLRRGAGHLWIQGEAQLKAFAYNGKGGDARFNYRIADNMAYLDAADVSAAGARILIAHLSAAIPVQSDTAKLTRFPASVDFDGCSVKERDFEVSLLAGRLRGNLQTGPAGRWLEGTADLASGRVAWQGNVVAAPAARVVFSRPGAVGELNGKLLGGTLSGSVSGNPFAPEAGASFDLRLKDAELAGAAPFFLKNAKISPTGGLVDLNLSGAYSRRDGLSCRFVSKGSRIALTGAGKKTLISGAALSLAGNLAAEKLSIDDATISPDLGVALRMKGELAHPFSKKRTGSLTFSLQETAANNIVVPLVNLLPRVIQEATLDGTLAAQGKLELQGGGELLEGSLVFKGGHFEVPQQKLVVSGINGRFPFSLDLAGKAGGKPPSSLMFSRENFPQLLTRLRHDDGGEVLSIGKVGFGPMELGTLTMHVSAKNGITEITSLSSSLYEGALLGRGYLSLRDGFNFRGDLLLNGLSLKQLCSIFPGIKGYISGRVDGVISISGDSKGFSGLSGFTELWAREGSGEKMLVSKEFLQRLANQKLSGFFFSSDRSYDAAEIKAMMEEGNLTFETLQIVHTNLVGVRDLNVSIAPTQNRIALDHLLDSIKQAAVRGKPSAAGKAPAAGEKTPSAADQAPAEAPATQEFKWGE
jgi:hypothetical protein